MNMNPDELTLARWLDDELCGKELSDMDAWASSNPEQLEAREELRNFRMTLKDNIVASEEPPYPDFFMTRLHQGIRDVEGGKAIVEPSGSPRIMKSLWSAWLMPLAACAGVVLAFVIGRQTVTQDVAVKENMTVPVLYTPEEGVAAEWVASGGTNASVIILQGVAAIPDATDFSSTVYVPTAREFDRTATLENEQSEQEN
jgi:hypothetical protein